MSYASDALIDAQERDIKKLKAENDKLRAERDEWHRVAVSKQDIIDHMRDARVEDAKLRTQLADVTESMGRVEERCAKLRELVRDYDKCLDTALYLAGNAGYPCMPDSGLFSSLHPRMRELGIEVGE